MLKDDWPAVAQSLVLTLVIAVFVITFVVQAFEIPSESMENTLLIGDYVLVDKFSYGGTPAVRAVMPYKEIQRGDVVVFHYPVRPAQHFVKRVVAVPGDRIRLVDKHVFLNGVPLKEPYVRYSGRGRDWFRDDVPRTDLAPPGLEPDWWLQMKKLVEDNQLIVPVDSYFVMGDNRDESLDSRYWGFVPRENIIGRPLLIYWSVQDSNHELAGANSASDKIYNFAYAVTHILKITRWDRTLRLIE